MRQLTQDEQDIFFAIIRAAIWEREVECTIPESTDWNTLIEAFQTHSILGTVASTLIQLSAKVPQLSPYADSILFPYVANLTRTHIKQNAAIVEVFKRLESQGCHPVLLKGQGLSALYPKTCVRSCGDIDLYIGEKEYEKACTIINDMLGIDNDTDYIREQKIHYHVEKDGVIYEVHRIIIDKRKYVGNNSNINSISHDILSSEHLHTIDIQDKAIRIPSAEFNTWYIFFHLYKHFLKGVGIRQFIDWLFFIKTNKDFDIQKLQNNLKAIGLVKEWNHLGYILTHYLGLPTEDFPLYDAEHHIMSDYNIQSIIYCGDFGKNASRNLPFKNKKGISRTFAAFIYHTSNIRKVAKNRSWGYALYSYKSTVKKGLKSFYRNIFR